MVLPTDPIYRASAFWYLGNALLVLLYLFRTSVTALPLAYVLRARRRRGRGVHRGSRDLASCFMLAHPRAHANEPTTINNHAMHCESCVSMLASHTHTDERTSNFVVALRSTHSPHSSYLGPSTQSIPTQHLHSISTASPSCELHVISTQQREVRAQGSPLARPAPAGLADRTHRAWS